MYGGAYGGDDFLTPRGARDSLTPRRICSDLSGLDGPAGAAYFAAPEEEEDLTLFDDGDSSPIDEFSAKSFSRRSSVSMFVDASDGVSLSRQSSMTMFADASDAKSFSRRSSFSMFVDASDDMFDDCDEAAVIDIDDAESEAWCATTEDEMQWEEPEEPEGNWMCILIASCCDYVLALCWQMSRRLRTQTVYSPPSRKDTVHFLERSSTSLACNYKRITA